MLVPSDGSDTTKRAAGEDVRRRLRFLCCGGLAGAALLASSCTVSDEAKAGRELAGTVKIEGYRKVNVRYAGEGAELYFVGPPGIDPSKAVSARGWSPEPPIADLPDTGLFKWIAESEADTERYDCHVVVSTLRPGQKRPSVGVSEQEQQEVADGKLAYVLVTCSCVER